MHEALSPPFRHHTARKIEEVCIDYQRLIRPPAARWLQNNNLLVSTLVTELPTRFSRWSEIMGGGKGEKKGLAENGSPVEAIKGKRRSGGRKNEG
jgi:hypothetical protein